VNWADADVEGILAYRTEKVRQAAQSFLNLARPMFSYLTIGCDWNFSVAHPILDADTGGGGARASFECMF
jgi:hypothetical protein